MRTHRNRITLSLADRFHATITKLAWLPLLLARVTLGIVFVTSGWGKLQHIGKVVDYFTELGISGAAFNAHLVAFSELICGALLLIGLVTRLASIPLLITMVVALATAKAPDIHQASDLFGMTEFTYALLLLTLAVFGAGLLSVDALLMRRREARRSRLLDADDVRVDYEPRVTAHP